MATDTGGGHSLLHSGRNDAFGGDWRNTDAAACSACLSYRDSKPDIDVSTAFVYGHLQADRLSFHPDIDGMAAALAAGDLKGITDRMGNVLETVTAVEYPVIDRLKRTMCGLGAENALMSGSGPSIFGVFLEEGAARAAGVYIDQTLKTKGIEAQVNVTGFYNQAS